jgi:integrase
MPIFKKPQSNIWYIDFTDANGKRVKKSTGTQDRKAALELHDRLKADAWRESKLGETPDHTFDELAVKYLRSELGSKYYRSKCTMVEYWLTQFSGRGLRSLTTSVIKTALPTTLQVERLASRKMSTATQNRYLSCINRMLTMAVELEWLVNNPKLKMGREPKINVRWITSLEAQKLLDCAQDKPWLYNIIRFALATGCRAGEITSLEWSSVDMDAGHAWINADKAKSGYSRGVPLNSEAIASMQGRPRTGRVFLGSTGNELGEISRKAFQKACSEAGIENFRFHDLRHTWASWHAQKGTPLMALKELGGWEDVTMVQKYAHMGASHLADYATNVLFSSHPASVTLLKSA